MLYRGYAFGISDQAFYLSYLYRWNDPSLYPNDYLFAFLDYRENVAWPILGWIGKVVSYEALFGVLYVVSSFLALLLVYRIAFSLWGKRSTALLAALLWTPTYMVPVAIVPTFDLFFTVRTLGMLFGLWLTDRVVRSAPSHAGAVSFLGGVIHLISVLPIALGLGLASLVQRRWKTIFALGGGLILAAGTLLVYWHGHGVGHPVLMRYSEPWYDLVKALMPDLFAEAWGWRMWVRILALPAIALSLLKRSVHSGADLRKALLLWWAALGISGYALLGAAGTGIFRSYLAMQLCPFRGYYYLLLFSALALAGPAMRLVEARRWPSVFVAGWVVGAWMTDETSLQVLAALLLLAEPIFPILRDRVRKLAAKIARERLAMLGLLLFVLACLVADALMAQYGTGGVWLLARNAVHLPSEIQVALMRATVFALFFLAVGALLTRQFYGRAAWMGLVALIGVTVLLPPAAVIDQIAQRASTRSLIRSRIFRIAFPLSTPTFKMAKRYADAYEKVDAGRRLAFSARGLLPLGATVIVPPSWEFFRERSLRSSFVTFKDRGPTKDSKEYADYWCGRMNEVKAWRGAVSEEFVDTLPLHEGEVIALARRYRSIHLDFIATPRTYPFPLVAQEGPFRLYRIPLNGLEGGP